LRLNTPLAPALRLGADRLLIVGLRHMPTPAEEAALAAHREANYSSLAYLAGKVLNALLLDHVDYDVDRLRLVNAILDTGARAYGPEFLRRINQVIEEMRGTPYRVVRDVYVLPSRDLAVMAAECLEAHRGGPGLRAWVSDAALRDPVRGHQLYNEYLDMLEYADQMGFDAIGVNEHHQNGYGMMPSPNLMAAALARRCQNANLLVLGNSIALYNPPVRVAEEFAMLDVISGGRLIAGFPVGTSMDINYCYGQNPATVRDKYREAHDLIIKAWAEREPFAWNGKYTKL